MDGWKLACPNGSGQPDRRAVLLVDDRFSTNPVVLASEMIMLALSLIYAATMLADNHGHRPAGLAARLAWIARVLAGLFGATLAVSAAQANRTAHAEVAAQRLTLQQRVAAVRPVLHGAEAQAHVRASPADSWDVTQWFNWPNWNNWGNWGNWPNWNKLFNR